jgi:DNA sulfur modification protein DndB
MLKPAVLLKIGFVLHRTDGNKRKNTYQRYVKKTRLASVNDYIVNKNGFFPNSIIVNFDFDLSKSFNLGAQNMQGNDSHVKVGTIELPDRYKSAFIIDGQHRLYGYAGTSQKDTEVIPVIAFSKLPPEKQTNMFVDINTKAKAVKRNLIESLNGELYWNSRDPKYALLALHSMLALDLNDRPDSPLHNLIEIGDSTGKKKTEAKKDITLTYFIDNGLKKENFFVKTYAKSKDGYVISSETCAV